MEIHIVLKSEMHSDYVVEVFASKEDAQKSAEGRDKVDNDANYYVESHVVIGASDRTERMKLEKAEFVQRITKLLAFMESEKFAELEAIDKRLLMMQYSGMETYRTALELRLLREDMKRYECDIKALKAQAERWKEEGKTDAEIASMLTEEIGKVSGIGNANNDALWMLWES